ncbi:uncharacterized protein LOC118514061 [Anopheles stephensi]|uniref:uncharacterized protein LOC118514061 n=1 Tax=Anopheles stephensi TaxID=30069 RepID=UPI00165874AB|nr:uncharacterized protein LOC118514061 [Anopheles stephensi]
MPSSCAVKSCANSRTSVKQRGLSVVFFEFPKQIELRKCWEQFCNRGENWSAGKYSVVCSVHFKAEDFQIQHAPLMKSRSLTKLQGQAFTTEEQERNNEAEIEHIAHNLYNNENNQSVLNFSVINNAEPGETRCSNCDSHAAQIADLKHHISTLEKEQQEWIKLREANSILKDRLDMAVKEKADLKKTK